MDKSVVFDFNADDDVGWGKNLGVVDNVGEVDDCKWIQEFFNNFEKKCDGSNDVVLGSSDVSKNSSKDCVKDFDDDDDDDDDCVILDGDPDKAVEGQNVAVGNDSDELVVVGETGQVACRDYPHPRDLCAKFPFTSTPHEQYCNQCHCYVCDSLAPCLQWGTGISSSDHCHATGKEEIWNQQRESLKKSHQSTVPVPKVQCTSMSTQPIQTNQSPASTPHIQYNIVPSQVHMSAPVPSIQYHTPQTQFPRPAPNKFPRPAPNTHIQYQTFQAQTPRPKLIWPSATVAMNMPSIRGQSYVMPINNLQLNLASQQLRNTGNNALSRDRKHTSGSLGPRVNVLTAPLPAAVFKRRGTPGIALASIPSNQKNGCLINGNGSTMYTRVHRPVLAPGNCHNMISAEKNVNSNICWPSSQPYMQPSNFMAFQSQLQPRLFSQSSVATTSLNSVPTQPLLSTLSNTGTVFVDSTTQPQIPSPQAYVGGIFSRSVSPQPQVSSQPIITNSFGNTVPSEPPVYSQPNHASNNDQSVFQQQNQTNNIGDATSFSHIDFNWLSNTTDLSSQQPQAQNNQLPALGFFYDSPPFGEFNCFVGGSSNTGSFDLDHDNWTLNSEELARLTSVPASATLDSGTLFGQ